MSLNTDKITCQEAVLWKTLPVLENTVRAENKAFIISGRFIKTASLKKEWQEDIGNPEQVIRILKASPARIDILRFWQRIPETEPKYDYYHEWRQIAAIPISNYENWWANQINYNTRRLVRKSAKLGVDVREAQLDDQLVFAIIGIFNESPIRRGKPFRHYGKDFETVKKEMSADLGESVFITAHYESELIGFIKLLVADRYAMLTMILDKESHRDKTPVNGMLAEAVKMCAERRIPFLTYTLWRRGGHAYFQERNGFQKIPVPEYYIPLTWWGRVALNLGLHNGLKGLFPEAMMVRLLGMRAKWYSLTLARKTAPRAGAEGRVVDSRDSADSSNRRT